MNNKDLYKNIPHKLFNGDVTRSNRLKPDEVMKLVVKLGQKKFRQLNRNV